MHTQSPLRQALAYLVETGVSRSMSLIFIPFMLELKKQNTYVHLVSVEIGFSLLMYGRSGEGIATPLRATSGFACFAYNQ